MCQDRNLAETYEEDSSIQQELEQSFLNVNVGEIWAIFSSQARTVDFSMRSLINKLCSIKYRRRYSVTRHQALSPFHLPFFRILWCNRTFLCNCIRLVNIPCIPHIDRDRGWKKAA